MKDLILAVHFEERLEIGQIIHDIENGIFDMKRLTPWFGQAQSIASRLWNLRDSLEFMIVVSAVYLVDRSRANFTRTLKSITHDIC
jgi:hypothetical protein